MNHAMKRLSLLPATALASAALLLSACGSDANPAITSQPVEPAALAAVEPGVGGTSTTATHNGGPGSTAPTPTVPRTTAPTPTLAAPATTEAVPPTTEAAPPATEAVPPTTEAAPPTTPTTEAVPPTTEPTSDVGPNCSTANYDVVLPPGWFHDACTTFSEAAIPGPNAEIEFGAEIDLFFASSETFREALVRLNETETILSSELTTVDGGRAVRMEIDEGPSEFFGTSGRRMTYVVDAGQGVFFAAGVENVDAGSVQLYANTAEQYDSTVAQLDVMMSNLSLNHVSPAPVTCPSSVSITSPEVVNSGEADLNGDGDLEKVELIYDADDNAFVTIEGLVPGIVSGQVELGYRDPFNMLGWADWDGDGSPEIFTREGAGPAAGDLNYAATVVGCDIVPVTNLLSTGSTQYSDLYRCDFGTDGTMTSFTNRSWRADVSVDPYVFTTTTTESTYVAGVLLSSAPVTTVSNDPGGNGLPQNAVTWGLASCGEFFDPNN